MNKKPLSLVFTGHMVDLPGRSQPRFPSSLVEAAGLEIQRRIVRLSAGRPPESVKGFASLARGGDILFHEICRKLGFETVIVLPFTEETFLQTSVSGVESGDWEKRFRTLWAETPPDRRHDLRLPESDEAYAVCNERILALAFGWGQVQLLTLWNGGGGDGPGGTAHFIKEVKRELGQEPEIINPNDLR